MYNISRHKTAEPLKPSNELSKEELTELKTFIEKYKGGLSLKDRNTADKTLNRWFEKIYGESVCSTCNMKFKFTNVVSYAENKEFTAPKTSTTNVAKSVPTKEQNI